MQAQTYFQQLLLQKLDELNRDFILQATDQYFNVDKPNFIADEKKRSANIDFIATKLSPVYANYADANNITLSDVNTRDFISSINDLSNEELINVSINFDNYQKVGGRYNFPKSIILVLGNKNYLIKLNSYYLSKRSPSINVEELEPLIIKQIF